MVRSIHGGPIAPLGLALLMCGAAVPAVASWTPSTIHATPVGTPVPAPFMLRATTSIDECRGHGGTVYCSVKVTSPLLIWEWISNSETANGFRLYNVTGNRTLSMEIPSTRQRIAGDILDAEPGTCWVVTAYASNVESADSNRWCPPK